MKRVLLMLLMLGVLGASVATSEASAAARARSGIFGRSYNGAQYNMPNRQGGYGYYSFGFRGFPFGYSSGAFSGNNRN